MDEQGNGFNFDLIGTFCSGTMRGQPFHGTYSIGTRTGSLTVGN
jgi:hypothetical protein